MRRLLLILFLPTMLWAQETTTDEVGEVNERAQTNVFAEAKGKLLRWKLKPKDLIEVKKYAIQKIKLNGKPVTRYAHHRILMQVKDKNKEKGYQFSGTFESKFRFERKVRVSYQAEEYHKSNFYIEPRGRFHMAKNVYMPNVRNIPFFPATEDPNLEGKNQLKKGDSWESAGTEVMRFGKRLIKLPLEVTFEYGGRRTVNSNEGYKNIHKIIVNYNINYENAKNKGNIPKKAFGYATAIYFWDEEAHMPYYAQEDYNIIMMYSNGQTSEFQIKSKSAYRKIKPLGKKKKKKLQKDLTAKIAKAFKNKKAPTVKKVKDGLSINLPDVLFEYNSDELTDDSEDVLNGIIDVLEEYPGVHVRVQGHTDNTGAAGYNKKLSNNRAKSVVDYIMTNSNMKSERFSYKGLGESQPIASNKTPSGRKKNRRVEFIILDK